MSRWRPRKTEPQLLVLPCRDRVEQVLRRNCGVELSIRTIELERNQTIQFGEVFELMAFVNNPETGGHIAVRHMMPGGVFPGWRALESGAEMLGQVLGRRFGAPRRENDAARMLRMAT